MTKKIIISAILILCLTSSAHAECTVEAFFSPYEDIEGLIVDKLKGAGGTIRCSLYGITNSRITEVLINRVSSGVDIKLCLDKTQSAGKHSTHKELKKAGAEVVIKKTGIPEHNKFCVIDDKAVIMGGFVNKIERIKDYMRRRGGDPFYITIFGSSDYGNKVLSHITAGLPSVILRISAAELKAYPYGVTGRVFSFLFADLYGFIVLDQEVLKYLSGASDDNELLYLIYARARANRKNVIAITEQMPLPERVSFHSSLYICSRQRLKKLTAVYPGIESAAIIHGEDYYDYFKSLFEQVKCFLRR